MRRVHASVFGRILVVIEGPILVIGRLICVRLESTINIKLICALYHVTLLICADPISFY
jgi:hypothetical protein